VIFRRWIIDISVSLVGIALSVIRHSEMPEPRAPIAKSGLLPGELHDFYDLSLIQ
jgi:hypothetical protein